MDTIKGPAEEFDFSPFVSLPQWAPEDLPPFPKFPSSSVGPTMDSYPEDPFSTVSRDQATGQIEWRFGALEGFDEDLRHDIIRCQNGRLPTSVDASTGSPATLGASNVAQQSPGYDFINCIDPILFAGVDRDRSLAPSYLTSTPDDIGSATESVRAQEAAGAEPVAREVSTRGCAIEKAVPKETLVEDAAIAQIDMRDITFADVQLMANNGFGNQTMFSSLDEAHRSAQRRVPLPADETIPKMDAEKRVLVLMLRAAVKQTADTVDSQKITDHFAEGQVDEKKIELACWKVLEKIVERHHIGGSFTEAHRNKEAGTFFDRFKEAYNGLKHSKSLCKHLMDADFIDTFVDDPAAALRRVVANKKLNDRKCGLIKAGTQALSQSGRNSETPTARTQTAEGASPDDDFPPLLSSARGSKRRASGTEKVPPAKRAKHRKQIR